MPNAHQFATFAFLSMFFAEFVVADRIHVAFPGGVVVAAVVFNPCGRFPGESLQL